MTPWRIAGWGLAVALLLTPAIAMQFTSEVNWTFSDFVVAAVMFLVLGGAIEFIVRAIRRGSTRLLAFLAVIGAFLWLWAELAVGVFTNWGS
jgi:peptidoglycan/LPS O-acetylase OafA/YrhL